MGGTLREIEQTPTILKLNLESGAGGLLDDRSFRILFAKIPLGVCVITADQRITEANRALSEMLGYAEGELVGKSVDDITDPADAEPTHDFIRRLPDPGNLPQTRVMRFRRKDGTTVVGKITAEVIPDAMMTIGYTFAIVEDLTEQLRDEAERAQARASESALAIDQARLEGVIQTVRETLHQVGNALTEAQGYTQLALFQNDLPAPARDLLTRSMNGFDQVSEYLQSLRKVWRVAGPEPGIQKPESRIPKPE